ncbi:tRNA dihydrouridine synthase [Marinobacter sp. X15-166B]|uniref:tRNA dihydrouridine synthase n=1 Tax=Marinobacter sp. X15-166B TaxID=1897620 RepID=UPI00085C1FAB|nr:tRNA-dihydrouridine synthase [Marinobacter sp. X15-166B]OEY67311.1 tRNA dihydrouridine(16) synthase DusC [Marinobacter sp. X15-166B]
MRIILAPMEGLADAPIREILTAVGGIDRSVTEFIRVTHTMQPDRVFHKYAPELKNGCTTRSGAPVAIQLLGSDPEQMGVHGARAVELGAPQVDINFGCPAKTVNRHKGGSVLMREPEVMHRITAAVRAAVPAHIPVTAKMRLGYDDRSMGIACGQALEAAGAAEIVIHARSKVDGYKPPAYWEEIARVREAVQTRVIANGEIWTVDDYWRCREVSGCDDIMIGRGLIARPGLARQIKASQQGDSLADLPWAQVVPLIKGYGEELQGRLEDRYVTGRLKQWLNYLRKGYSEAEQLWPAARKFNEVAPFYACLDASLGAATQPTPTSAA